MLTGMWVKMATMLIRRKTHCKATMDEHRMWRPEGIIPDCVKIGQYSSDLKNTIMPKQMQRQARYPKRRLYCNK
jgi:hypothetical protein